MNTGSFTRPTRVLTEKNEIREVWMTETPMIIAYQYIKNNVQQG